MNKQMNFEVRQTGFSETRFAEDDASVISDGQILLAIDSFAFTANNITYAAVGHEVGYWKFFPGSEEGWGRIPVWGFADVVESSHPQIDVGERIYGYWPMSTHLVMQPDKVSEVWFFDATEHRRELPSVYNQYYRCAADPGYRAETEDLQSIFRPLFITSFMIDDFLVDNEYFGAQSVIISSASSKTAFGTAFLQQRRNDRSVIGMTSAGNKAFVESLGCYDEVLTYDQVDALPSGDTVYVDIAGNSDLRWRIHHHYGDQLKFSSAVGYSHLGTLAHGQKIPGPKPQFFFAPAQVQKREQDWRDSGGVLAHYAEAWQAFMQPMRNWIAIHHGNGTERIEAIYQQTLAGKVSPVTGNILSW